MSMLICNDNFESVEMYTDGSCKGNPGPGGWGMILYFSRNEKIELSGGESQTTCNRMELTAVIKGLDQLHKPYHVTLYTDSLYVKNGISSWLKSWKKNQWKTLSKKQVKNVDLWEKLDQATSFHFISPYWIKSHTGSLGNNRADSLARQAANKIMIPKQLRF